jgi:hypothetical protein
MNPEAELIALRTMCKAAAAEIREHWEAHCDATGYGPCNLVARLAGDIPPDLYPGHATSEEIDGYERLTLDTPATPPKLTDGYRHNFATLQKAAGNEDLCLVSAIRKSDRAPVALVCAHMLDAGGMRLVPLAQMIEGNPYEMYEDPTV